MIPQKLSISGFLSYQEAVEVDFSALHVACISGQNGAGKSAMLDAMTWALFGEARKNDESIINDAQTKRRAEVIFDFEYENSLYRIDRVREVGKTSTVDFFIFDNDSSQWKPLSEKRVTETNKRISDVLHMDYKTFINASFFLQGKADQFTSQNAAERKQILSNILDLDVWEKYKERATEERKTAEKQLALIDSDLTETEQELNEEDQRREELAGIEDRLKTAEEKRLTAAQSFQNARDAEQILQSQQKTVNDLKIQDDRLFKQIETNKKTLADRQNELDGCKARLAEEAVVEENYAALLNARRMLTELSEKARKHYQLEKEQTALKSRIEREQTRLKSEIQSLQREEANVRIRGANVPAQQAQLDELQKQISVLRAESEKKSEWIARRDSSIQAETDKKAENLRLKKEMNDLRAHINALKEQAGGLCPVCGRDMDEEHCASYAAQLETEGKSLAEVYRTNDAEMKTITAQNAEIITKISEIEAAESSLLRLEKQAAPLQAQLELAVEEADKWEKDGALRLRNAQTQLDSVDFCASEKAELLKKENEIKANAYDEALTRSWQDKESALSGAEQARQALEQAKGAAGPLEREIAELDKNIKTGSQEWLDLRENLDAQQKRLEELTANMPDVRAVKLQLDEAQKEENLLRGQKGQAEQLVAVLEGLKISYQRLKKSRTETLQLIDHLKLLEKAFGKNGIPALLIEQALPEIEEQANQLLGRLSNDRMSLHFDTLRDYKDKKKEDKRETLDILISDDYGMRTYELFSGGEAFRINFAIRLALSRMLARRSGSRLQTLVIDEGFGSQDADGRARLVEAITEVQDDFEKILVITHLDELKEAFPSRIEVEKTINGSKVEVYP